MHRFFWNIAIGLLLYAAIFLAAPLVADYFDNPLFIPVLRLQGVIIIVNAFGSVQISRLSKTLQFKVLAIRSLIAAIVGTAIGVGLVACGYGIWGLVWQAIVTSGVSVVLLWSIARWRPQMLFSWSAFRQMFGFGSYIFVSNICNTLYTNVQSFIIGKAFSVRDLGYYSQAQKLEQVPAEGTSSVLAQVLFPVYASIADDRGRHIDAVRKNMKVISFVTFPLMMLLIIVAFPLIRLMLTDKWIQSIPMFPDTLHSGYVHSGQCGQYRNIPLHRSRQDLLYPPDPQESRRACVYFRFSALWSLSILMGHRHNEHSDICHESLLHEPLLRL